MFKFIVVCAMIASAVALPPLVGITLKSLDYSGSIGSHHVSGDEVHADIKNFVSDVNDHGFQYAYDTTNNIHAAATGDEHGDHRGDFSWISPEGEHIAVQYVADENGYQPSSAWLPTPPPIPEAILKALEYIRTHPPKEEHNTFNNFHGLKSQLGR
ncbi:larval cuticle protein 2-like [Musca vetustissima]|uniref:larval cuticle protein 2-like n=1 Tax=Musca vetustissima TaxID=27455 RepID=UPI002AB730C5|nr:larval cuticle protein 2-like [Musca vetustissima]